MSLYYDAQKQYKRNQQNWRTIKKLVRQARRNPPWDRGMSTAQWNAHVRQNWQKRKALMQSIRRRPRKMTTKRLAKRVKKISKLQQATMGHLTYRSIEAGIDSTAENEADYTWIPLTGTSNLESVVAQLRYYNPSAPTTLVTADFTSGTYQKEVLIDSAHMNIVMRNNDTLPIHLVVYSFHVKDDTSITPVSAMSNGYTDQTNLASYKSPLLFPTDLAQVTDLWKVKKLKAVALGPGRECQVSLNVKDFQYDPSLTDSHPQIYQQRNKGCGILFRYIGGVAKDQVNAEEGISNVKIQWLARKTYKVSYDAGADIRYIYGDVSGLDSFTVASSVMLPVQPAVDQL